MNKRQADAKAAQHLYRLDAPKGLHVCRYCGDSCNTVDHIPALSVMAAWPDHATVVDCRMVPACQDCNIRLGICDDYAIDARCKHITKSLRASFKRLLTRIHWDAAEIAELGPSLRTSIEAIEQKRQWLEARLITLALGGRM